MRRVPEWLNDIGMVILTPFWLVFAIVTFFLALPFGAYGNSFWRTYIFNLKGLRTPPLKVWWEQAKHEAKDRRWDRDRQRMRRNFARLNETLRQKGLK